MNQKRQPRGITTGGQFAPDVNPECTVVLATVKDETVRTKSDDYLEQFAEDAMSNFDNWIDDKSNKGDDWNEWSHADIVEFYDNVVRLIQDRRAFVADMVLRIEIGKMAKS